MINFDALERHRKMWEGCRRCPLGPKAYHHVLLDLLIGDEQRVDVLVIGEGPGESEDAIGKPFIGRSGKVLRKALEELAGDNPYAITNTVACRPTEGVKNRPPHPSEILRCRPRVEDLLTILNPLVVVTAGRVAQQWYPERRGTRPVFNIPHPAHVCRAKGETKDRLLNELNAGIRQAFETSRRIHENQETQEAPS